MPGRSCCGSAAAVMSSPSRPLPNTWPSIGQRSGQTWKTFLHNHAAGIGAMDFLVVPTIGFRLLFVCWSS